jgi:hypothetical protein
VMGGCDKERHPLRSSLKRGKWSVSSVGIKVEVGHSK